MLVYEPPDQVQTDTTDDDDEYQFHTQSGAGVSPVGGGEPLAVLLEKTKDNAFVRRVTVGRTSNNDVVLDDSSVSRFHAWFEREDFGEWFIADAGSRNGTWVQSRKLTPRTPSKLFTGHRIRIGVVELTFHTAEGFLKLLRERA